MLFASDLDQTLIYSERAFRLAPDQPKPPLSLVEVYEGKNISFMTESTVARLGELNEYISFVPVTTRTIEQYRRIVLFQQTIVPGYAVVSNGGNILANGMVDEVWNRRIRKAAQQHCADSREILGRFEELKDKSWVLSGRTADELFHYFVVDRDNLPLDEVTGFAEYAEHYNWNVSLQGRKLYLVPKVVNKWDAIAYVQSLTDEATVAAAGDSLLDLCLLEQADIAVAPSHGEIWDKRERGETVATNIWFTKRAGIHAADDILEYIQTAFRCTVR